MSRTPIPPTDDDVRMLRAIATRRWQAMTPAQRRAAEVLR